MITERDVQVLLALSRYYVLNRPQIQRLCFPDDKTGRRWFLSLPLRCLRSPKQQAAFRR